MENEEPLVLDVDMFAFGTEVSKVISEPNYEVYDIEHVWDSLMIDQ